MDDPQPTHETVSRDGTRLHVARLAPPERRGTGARDAESAPTLLFLHGWPEFWWTWSPVMERLSARGYDCVAPDLRGFGDSDKAPEGRSDRAGPDVHAADALAVLEALALGRVGVVSHDVGAYAAQSLARLVPARLAGLFFFNCPHPGIGPRGAAPEMLKEIWYQSFNQLPLAADLVGASRDTIRTYIGTMLRHWAAGNPGAFDDDTVERFTDNFAKPGNLQGGFNWYISQGAARLRMLEGEVSRAAPIAVPTCVRWGDRDPILPVAWSDTLGDTFTDLDLRPSRASATSPTARTPTGPPTPSTPSTGTGSRADPIARPASRPGAHPQASLSQRRMSATAFCSASGPG